MTDNIHYLDSYEPPAPANDLMPRYRVRVVIQAPPAPQRASYGALWGVAGVLWVGVIVILLMT